MENYYELLEVNENASQEVIEKVYKTLAKKYHPDLNPDNPKAAEEKFKKVSAAYEVLSNETKRKEYDQKLQAQKMQEYQRRAASAPQTTSTGQTQPTHSTSTSRPSSTARTTTSTNRGGYQYVDAYSVNENYRKMQEAMAQKAYNDAYYKALRDMGYDVVYEKPFKEKVRDAWTLLKIVATIATIGFIIWQIPFTHDLIVDWYNSSGYFKAFWDTFTSRL
jgi:curved DNA-binding protein CbpA